MAKARPISTPDKRAMIPVALKRSCHGTLANAITDRANIPNATANLKTAFDLFSKATLLKILSSPSKNLVIPVPRAFPMVVNIVPKLSKAPETLDSIPSMPTLTLLVTPTISFANRSMETTTPAENNFSHGIFLINSKTVLTFSFTTS